MSETKPIQAMSDLTPLPGLSADWVCIKICRNAPRAYLTMRRYPSRFTTRDCN